MTIGDHSIVGFQLEHPSGLGSVWIDLEFPGIELRRGAARP
jgi:hypothetical protein